MKPTFRFIKISLFVLCGAISTPLLSQRLMEINAMFDNGYGMPPDTGILSTKVNFLISEIRQQQSVCTTSFRDTTSLPSTTPGLTRNPLFNMYYNDIKKRQAECIVSIQKILNEYNSLLDTESGRLLQRQAMYLQHGEIKQEILDTFLIFQKYIADSRKSYKRYDAVGEIDSLTVTYDTAQLNAMSPVEFIEKTNRAIQSGNNLLEDLSTSIKKEGEMLKKIQARTNAWLNPKKDENPDKSEEVIAGIPQLIHTDNVVTPSLSMVAGAKRVKGPWYNELGVFVGNSEERNRRNIQSIFNAEQSEYGFYIRGAVMEMRFLQVKYQKNWAFHYNLNYLEKSINEDTIQSQQSVNFSQFQGRLAGEYIVFNNFLSLYTGINWIAPLTNVKMYRERLPFQKDGQPYMDFGIRMFLEPGKMLKMKDSGLGIVLDVNFIVNNKDMRSVNSKGDSLVPGLRFAMQKTLSQ